MSTYKREVERTEQLEGAYKEAFNHIVYELKKDDNLSPTKMLDIPACIQAVKESRKRWASGNSPISIQGTYTNHVISVSIPTLNFTPSLIFIQIPENINKGVFYSKYGEMLPLMNFMVYSGYATYAKIMAYTSYSNEPIEVKFKKATLNNLNNIKLIEFNASYTNNSPQPNGGNKICLLYTSDAADD